MREPVGERARASCMKFSGSAVPTDTIRIVLTDAVSAEHAPIPRNQSEEILFKHLYGTLITLDCEREVRPSLAERWSHETASGIWEFTISRRARFWYGTPVKAAHVVESWKRTCDAATFRSAGIDSVAAAGARTLRVYVDRSRSDVPEALAEPPFSVALWPLDTAWPIGTGVYQLEPSEQIREAFSKESIDVRRSPEAGGPVVTFVLASAGDVRDLLPESADVMVTTAPDVIEYASQIPRLAVRSLTWKTTYVLLSPARLGGILSGIEYDQLTPEVLDELAVNAVRAPARGFRPPGWWEGLPACISAPDATTWGSVLRDQAHEKGPRRIVYRADDSIAGELSERIVALMMADPSITPQTAVFAGALPAIHVSGSAIAAVGLEEREFHRSLRRADEYAYIVAVPAIPSSPCYGLYRLMSDAPWLAARDVDPGMSIVPLIDVRPHVIADRTQVGVWVDWQGNVYIGG